MTSLNDRLDAATEIGSRVTETHCSELLLSDGTIYYRVTYLNDATTACIRVENSKAANFLRDWGYSESYISRLTITKTQFLLAYARIGENGIGDFTFDQASSYEEAEAKARKRVRESDCTLLPRIEGIDPTDTEAAIQRAVDKFNSLGDLA